jgi:hypothetical protein
LILPLEPVGRGWDKSHDAADGIAQSFVWKVTGPTPYGQQANRLDPTNATHWYGMSVGLRADLWRHDIGKAPPAIPPGIRLVFTLKPLGTSIDGLELQPVIVERTLEPNGLSTQDINDLPPAPYEVAGVAMLPDGTMRPLLLRGSSPDYGSAVRVALERDNLLGTISKPNLSYVLQ